MELLSLEKMRDLFNSFFLVPDLFSDLVLYPLKPFHLTR